MAPTGLPGTSEFFLSDFVTAASNTNMTHRLAWSLLMVVGLAALSRAQAPQIVATPVFEVASIKPVPPGTRGVQVNSQPGKLNMHNVNLRICLRWAYGIQDYQIAGGPDWLTTDRYDIVAKAEQHVEDDQLRLMLQTLLAERFQLAFHREKREGTTYALVVAKGGPKLHTAKSSDETEMGGGRGHISARNVPMHRLANDLSRVTGRPVSDQTGLPGNFDFTLDWTPDEGQLLGKDGGLPSDAPIPESSGPSIFTALQEQLGLKLEARKGPIETLVIDHVEKASMN